MILSSVPLAGATILALLLSGSSQHARDSGLPRFPFRDAGLVGLTAEGIHAANGGEYQVARDFFLQAAALAEHAREARGIAMNLSNVGLTELITMEFGAALQHFQQARRIAERTGEMYPLIFALNNLANLYNLTDQSENALRVAQEALAGPSGHADERIRAMLLNQAAAALFRLGRIEEAALYHYQGVDRLMELQQFSDAATALGNWGAQNLRVGRTVEAERAFSEGLRVARTHRIKLSAIILTGLGTLRGLQNEPVLASRFFETALAMKADRTLWKILAARGQFLLSRGDEAGALADFREASRIADKVRADMVPADQDRVAFETGIGQFLRGLVEAGNRLALKTGNAATLADTFDAAEQTRLWSLRSLLPSTRDWRSRLQPSYWEKLSRYQAIERKQLAGASPSSEGMALRLELQQIEAEAGGQAPGALPKAPASPLRHARDLLDDHTVLLAFHISETSSWLWAVDRKHARVFPLPPAAELARLAKDFSQALNPTVGRELYQCLFSGVPAAMLNHSRWLLELDGPLHDVPFAALVADQKQGAPVFLLERAVLQIIPSTVLLEKRRFRGEGGFLGVGDPVYNAADNRLSGKKTRPEFSLPRLPGTSRELEACSRAWGGPETRLLTGSQASLDQLRQAASSNPAILHFATHVVAGSGDYRSGLIALSLNKGGAMELLGPREILARPTSVDLVVMNGCHSGQAQSIPSSGRMGLTRAWIGAGAASVLATQWDISDDDSENLMTAFYRALRSNLGQGVAGALRQAQLAALHADRSKVARWAGHYVLSRAL